MDPRAARVQAALRAHGLAAQVRELAERTASAAEAAGALDTAVASIAKSLVFTTGQNDFVLVVASGANRVSTTRLAAHLGTPIELAGAATVEELTGFGTGGVPPVGYDTQPRTLVDRDLVARERIWAAAGTPQAVFPISPADLVRICDAEVLDLAER